MSLYGNTQGNLVQELRLQSNDPAARLNWVLGAFYSHNRQTAEQPISENFIINAPWVGFYPPDLAVGQDWGYIGFPGGAPFGGTTTAAQNFFGDNMLPNAVSFLGQWQSVETQVAAFAEGDYKFTEAFKVTGGVRISRNTLDFNAAYLGPENNSKAPFGFPCPTDSCTFGSPTDALAPVYPRSAAHSSETAVTPKIGVAYKSTLRTCSMQRRPRGSDRLARRCACRRSATAIWRPTATPNSR